MIACGAIGAAFASPAPAPADDTPGADDFAMQIPAETRVRMTRFLVSPAARAVKKRDWPLALALHQALVRARGPGSDEALVLADAWARVGQYDEAIATLDGFIAASRDPDAVQAARASRKRLAGAGESVARGVASPRAGKHARHAFRQGRAAARKGRRAEALLYFEIGYLLDPDAPGFLRELGAGYDALGLPDRKRAFYQAYLHKRPFGRTADTIRRELARAPGSLSTLTVTSSLPCDELWVNRQRVPARAVKTRRKPPRDANRTATTSGTPAYSPALSIGNLAVAPGRYRALCVNYQYEIAYFEYATVAPGGSASLDFRWAIVVNALTRPYGRITIENPRLPGVMMDLGISTPEVGVIVPKDGRALRLVVQDDAGARRDERTIALQPGQRHVIQW